MYCLACRYYFPPLQFPSKYKCASPLYLVRCFHSSSTSCCAFHNGVRVLLRLYYYIINNVKFKMASITPNPISNSATQILSDHQELSTQVIYTAICILQCQNCLPFSFCCGSVTHVRSTVFAFLPHILQKLRIVLLLLCVCVYTAKSANFSIQSSY